MAYVPDRSLSRLLLALLTAGVLVGTPACVFEDSGGEEDVEEVDVDEDEDTDEEDTDVDVEVDET